MTPAQLRGTRAVTRMKQDELADLMKGSRETTLGSNQAGEGRNANLEAITPALGAAGIQLEGETGVEIGKRK
jgi:hypothetical protein